MDFASIFSRLCVNFNVILLFREVIRVALTGLLHTEPVAVEVVGQSPAHILLRAVEHGFQDAGVGGADGFVLVGLEAELAQPLNVLERGEHVVKMFLHNSQKHYKSADI